MLQEKAIETNVGLVPGEFPASNLAGYQYVYGMRPTDFALRQYRGVVQPEALDDVPAEWPFPQIFRSISQTLAFSKSAVYSVANDFSAVSAITTYDARTPMATSPIATGGYPAGAWHFADFGKSWMAFNGACQVYRMGADTKVYVEKLVRFNTGCAFRGRLMLGGFVDAMSTDWVDFWDNLTPNKPARFDDELSFSMGRNFVAWSSIAAGDMLLWWIKALGETGYFGAHDSENPLILEWWKRGQLGFMPMPWPGNVLAIKPLGSSVVVYGENGISSLVPIVDGNGTPTFGLREISNHVGIVGRGAVGGDDKIHTWIDTDGVLWQMSQELQPQRLNYQWWIKNGANGSHVNSDALIVYNEGAREFWISSAIEDEAFLLNQYGLSYSMQRVSGAFYHQGAPVGFCEDYEDQTIRLRVNTTDLGTQRIKNIKGIHISANFPTEWQVALQYRTRTDPNAFISTSYRPFDQSGQASFDISCVEFRILLTRSHADDEVRLDGLSVVYSIDERMNIRSVFEGQ